MNKENYFDSITEKNWFSRLMKIKSVQTRTMTRVRWYFWYSVFRLFRNRNKMDDDMLLHMSRFLNDLHDELKEILINKCD